MRPEFLARLPFFGTSRCLAALVIAAGVLSGCATKPPASDPDAVADFEQTNDPLEPTNRVFYAIDNGLDTVILRPAALAYRHVVPGVTLGADRLRERLQLRSGDPAVAGIKRDRMLHVAIVPSTHAAARIRGIDASAALALPGVHHVVTGAEHAAAVDPMMNGLDTPRVRRYSLALTLPPLAAVFLKWRPA